MLYSKLSSLPFVDSQAPVGLHDVSGNIPPFPVFGEDERVDLDGLWDVSGDLIVWTTVRHPATPPLRRQRNLERVERGGVSPRTVG